MAWERRGYCEECDRYRLGKFIWPEHIKEGVLLTLSCGLYLPIWLWKVTRRRWACPRCGTVLQT